MTDQFDNPADAMRARMTNRLNCMHCKHIVKTSVPWCKYVKINPTDGSSGWGIRHHYCLRFSDNGKPMYGWTT